MTSPFVDRVEYQVIGRDVNASGVFRDVADAADSAGDSITGLGNDLDRVNRSIDDTGSRLRELLSSLDDLSATREITVTTNVREVLGSVEDNRQVLDLLNDRFENLTVNVIATVDQLVQLNDGITTIDDNRSAVIDLGGDVLQLTQNIDATVDSVVNLNDGLQTINDSRTAVVVLGDDVLALTQNIDATVDSVVNLNDGIQTIDDNRSAVVNLGDDVLALTQNIDATVDSVVRLADGIQTIDDNRTAVVNLGDDVLALTQNMDATVDSVVRLSDGIQTIDDNRTAVVNLGGDVRTLTQDMDATVDSVVRLRDGIQTIDDNRSAVIDLGNDVRTLTQNMDGSVDSVVRLRDGIQTIDDNRSAVIDLGNDARTLTQSIDATADSVVRLRDGIQTVDDNRSAITSIDTDFDNLGTHAEGTRQVVIRLRDDLATVDDNRNGISDLGNGFDDLATAIERSRTRVGDLNRDINNLPGGRDINNREIDVTRQVVETVSSGRDRLERAGLIAGAVVGHSLMTALANSIANGVDRIPFVGPLIKKMIAGLAAASPALAVAASAAGLLIAGAVAVVVANALTAGLLAALGGGVIAAAVIIALQDPRIMNEAKFTGAVIASTLGDAINKSGFKDELLRVMIIIREEFPKLKQGLTDLFSAVGPLMKPLVEGMLGFARNVLPGVTDAVRNMKPIFDQLAVWLPKLGTSIGNFFSKISEHAPQLASALGYVLGFLDTSIDVIGSILDGLAMFEPAAEFILHWTAELLKFFAPGTALMVGLQVSSIYFGLMWGAVQLLWRAISDLVSVMPSLDGGLTGLLNKLGPLGIAAAGTGGLLGLFGGKSEEAGSKASGLGSALGPAAAALALAGAKAAGAATDNQKLADAVRDAMNAANDFIGLGDAQSQMYEAMERGSKRVAEASGKDLKKGIDLSTAAGRENWRALRDIAAGANAAAGDITTMGGSAADAASVVQIARQKFIEVAGAMGIAAGDARILADKMFGIPDADPKVSLKDQASKGIAGIDKRLDGLDAYNAMPSVGLLDNASRGIYQIRNLLYRTDGQSATVTVNYKQVGDRPQNAASGGPVFGPGPKGVDSKLMMLAPGEHILTAPEVDAAGGHAAIMNFRRSLLNKHAAPMATTEGDFRSGRSAGRGIDANTLRQALSGMTLVIDDRTGRTATLIARGG